MAKMIPAFGPLATGSQGETVLFQIIKEQLSAEFTVIHSLPWLCAAVKEISESFAPTGEIDFLVIHPELGLLALEVKSGRYRVDGVTFVHLKFGTTITPVHQVRHNVHGLAQWLGTDKSLRLRIGYGLIFPDSDFGNEIVSTALVDVSVKPPQSIVIDKGQVPQLGTRIVEMMQYWKQTLKTQKLAGEIVDKLIQKLCPKFDGSPTWATRVIYDSHIWLPLTAEQSRVVAGACRQSRMVITGWPGTGKTLIGIALAREMMRQGKRVLVLTFNSLLMDHLARQLNLPPAEGMVSTWHSLCAQARKRLGLPGDFNNDAWYRSECANDLRAALNDKLLEDYDALILDEAQALRAEWYAVLLDWFHERKVVAFCDETQVFPFETGTTLKALCHLIGVDEPFLLTIALRTPKAVTERLLEVKPVSYQLQCPRPEELDTARELVVQDDWQTMLDIISQFKANGVDGADIIVLSKFGLTEKGKEAISDLGVSHEVVARFRGLEAPVVIVFGAEDMDEGQLFCAYSRATTAFVALYAAEVLGWQKTKGRFQELVMQNDDNQTLAETARAASLACNIVRGSVDLEWFPLGTVALGWCPSWGSWVAELEDTGPSMLWLDFLTSHYDWPVFYWDTQSRQYFSYLSPVESLSDDLSGSSGVMMATCEQCGSSPHYDVTQPKCVFCSGTEPKRTQRPTPEILARLKDMDEILNTSDKGKVSASQIGVLPISLAAYRARKYVAENGARKFPDMGLPWGRIIYRAALALVQSQIEYLPSGSRIETADLAKGWYERYSEIQEAMTFAEWKSTVSIAVSTCYQKELLSKVSKGVFATRLVPLTRGE